MANLPETPQWESGIYQIEVSDPVLGGPDGISNRQAKQLASRTSYLKQKVEKSGTDLAAHIAAVDPHTQYATKASPTFTGTPTAPTPANGDNSKKLATTEFVAKALAALAGSAPETLDTLKELADALGNDPNFATTVLNKLAEKLAKDQNGADIPEPVLFVKNLGLQETVNRAGNAVQRSGDKMTGKLTLPQTSAFGVNTNNVLGGNSIAFGDNDTGIKQNGDGILDVYANGQHVFRFQNGEVQSTTRTMKVSGALNVSGNTILLGNMNIFGAIAATGQVIPSDYRNFDARYQKRNGGVQDIRLGNQRVDGHYNDDFTVPSGHVVTGGDVAPSSALKLYSRPVQKLINGTWYNVASI